MASSNTAEDESDLIWGAESIGREINRTAHQIYHLYEIGALEGAVAKLGHRTFVGSRKQLRNLHQQMKPAPAK
jgi:hypothetical protein